MNINECFQYEIEEITNENFNMGVSSLYRKDDTFGFLLELGNKVKTNMFTSNPIELPYIYKSWSELDITTWTIELTENPIFPLNQKENIIKDIFYLKKYFKIERLVLLVGFKKATNWRKDALRNYEYHLQGIDLSSNTTVNWLKTKVQKVRPKEHNPINQEIEQKILDDNLLTVFKIGIPNKEKSDFLHSTLEYTLNNYKGWNKLTTFPDTNLLSLEFEENNRLSYKEIKRLFIGESVVIEEVKPIENTEVRDIQQSTVNNTNTALPDYNVLPYKEIVYSKNQQLESQLKSALKRVGLIKDNRIKVLNNEQGSTLDKITFKIPSDKTFSHFFKKEKDIQVALGEQSLTIQQGDQPDSIAFVVPRENRQPVFLRNMLESEEFQGKSKEFVLPFIVGVGETGEIIVECLSRIKHLLGAGATGGGKSVWVNQMILTLLLSRSSDELMMYLIDPKMVELSQFGNFPQVREVVTDMEESKNKMDSLVVEMEKRYEFLRQEGYKNINSYNKANPDKKVPLIVCVIDEYADLKETYPDVEKSIERLGAKARAAGIHLVVFTQKPLTDIVSSVLKTNLPSTLSFRLKTNSDYKTVFGTGIPYSQLLGNGDGVMQMEGQKEEFVRFQSPIITTDEEEEKELFEKLPDLFTKESANYEIATVKEESDLDKLKKIIAETKDTRVSSLQQKMKVRINKVQDLMQQLVEEGWLIKHKAKNKGYELIASEEELEKWLKE